MRKWKDASAIVSGPSSFSLRVLPAPYIGFLYLVGICCQRHSASQDVKLIMSFLKGNHPVRLWYLFFFRTRSNLSRLSHAQVYVDESGGRSETGMRWWRILHHGTPWNPWHSQLECAVKCNDINPCCPWATILLADASLVDERLTPRVILRSNLVHHFQYESTWNILKHLVHLGQNSIPSGYVKIAIENGHWFREFSH